MEKREVLSFQSKPADSLSDLRNLFMFLSQMSLEA